MSVKNRITKLFKARHILKGLVIKKFKTRYSGTIFGCWWAVVTPLILAFSINIVFTYIYKVGIPNFTLFVLSGIVPWLFFSNSIIDAMGSFSSEAVLMQQSIFPREFIPISCVFANFISFLIGLFFLLPLFLISKPQIISALPFLLLVFILNFIFILGIVLFLSTINVFFGDMMHFLSVGLMLWFWITPVFYSFDALAFPYRWVCLLNPLTYYTVLYRQVLYHGNIPSFFTISVSFLTAIIVFTAGYAFFINKESELFKKI